MSPPQKKASPRRRRSVDHMGWNSSVSEQEPMWMRVAVDGFVVDVADAAKDANRATRMVRSVIRCV